MAKAKKRIATPKNATKRRKASTKSARTRVSKRRKASAKAGRKKAARHATPKRPWKTTAKTASRKAPGRKAPVVEDTIIDVIDEPVPGVVRVTEYEAISMTSPSLEPTLRPNKKWGDAQRLAPKASSRPARFQSQ
jgi:hypothetical protein